jgi:methionyl-tRNA formyltransferase
MRLIFMATGGIALPSFEFLLSHGPQPLALVTQPDKPVGRRQQWVPSEVKTAALAAGIPVFQPERVGDCLPELAALQPDVIVVMAYGQILRKNILNLPSLAIINLHASLLPKYRGASCIQAAIAAGDLESGISVIHVVKEVDAGDVILAKSLPLAADETGGSLHDRLARLAPAALADSLAALAERRAARHPQDPAAASYAPKLARDDGRLDWSRDAAELERLIRAYDPWPGTFTIMHDDAGERRVKIFPPVAVIESNLQPGEVSTAAGELRIGCGTGALRIAQVQADGGRRMPAAEFVRGREPRRAS